MKSASIIPPLRGARGVSLQQTTAKHTLLTPLKGGIFASHLTRILLFFALLFFKTTALFAQTNLPDTSAHARLSVYSLEEGLPVFINGKAAGKTPLRKILLAAGHYEIVVPAAHDMSWLDEDWSERVALRAGDSLEVIARMKTGYRLNSVPYGAQVWLQGKFLGTTPYVLRLPESQTARVELRHPAYRAMPIEVGGRGETAWSKRNYEIVLEKDLDYAAASTQEHAGWRARIAKHRKLAYLSAAVSLAAGVGSVLLKREADEAYEQYLVSGDPAVRENYFARAEKYDRYYGASFALFEVSFGVSFYGFLKSLNGK